MPELGTDEHQPTDPPAAAAYLAAMIGELAAMARRHDFAVLAYLLDMAQIEAHGTVQQLDS